MAVELTAPSTKGPRLEWALWPLTDKIVLSRTTALPGSPTDGDIYIVPHAAGSNPDQIALRFEGAWIYLVPTEGWTAYVLDSNENVQFDGSVWQASAAGIPTSYLDTDGTLAANSDTKVATQKATKTYVDAKVAGLSWKQAVRAATTGAGTLASSFENGDTVDGVVLATGDRILIKNQSTGSENGIYTVNASGAPTRATDADSGAELVNASVYVSEGTTNADTQWTCTTNAPITVGSTSLAFAQLTSGGGSGDVVGPSSVTDQNPAVFDGTTGKLIKQLTYSAFTALLSVLVGDSGSGGIKGLVPAPSPGDAAAGKFLKADGTWAAPSGSGLGKYVKTFKPMDNEPPASNYATFDTLNATTPRPVLEFDAATQESAVFSDVLWPTYGGGGLTVEIYWAMDTATSGNVVLDAAIERVQQGTDSYATDSFATAQVTAATSVPGTAGVSKKSTLTFTNGSAMDSLAAGEEYRCRIRRVAADAGDTATGDLQVSKVVVREN
ncbi:MAG: DUF2793 domain-containing protein [Mesorhizobium sp.]|nr:MAG: DUF2793 domain-containing protein [Mesorhizobium sp.]